MKNLEEASKLAEMLIKIGKLAEKETICVITNMEEPLGEAVGNSLEVIEAIKFLKGTMPEDLKEVVLTLGAYMLTLAGKGNNIEENKQKMLEVVQNGKAFEKLKELVANQGGDVSYLENPEKFEKAKYIVEVKSTKDGYVSSLNAQKIGEISRNLGAGRIKKEDTIDASVGIILKKKVGDKVERGETIAYIHANNEQNGIEAKEELEKIYQYQETKIMPLEQVLKISN